MEYDKTPMPGTMPNDGRQPCPPQNNTATLWSVMHPLLTAATEYPHTPENAVNAIVYHVDTVEYHGSTVATTENW